MPQVQPHGLHGGAGPVSARPDPRLLSVRGEPPGTALPGGGGGPPPAGPSAGSPAAALDNTVHSYVTSLPHSCVYYSYCGLPFTRRLRAFSVAHSSHSQSRPYAPEASKVSLCGGLVLSAGVFGDSSTFCEIGATNPPQKLRGVFVTRVLRDLTPLRRSRLPAVGKSIFSFVVSDCSHVGLVDTLYLWCAYRKLDTMLARPGNRGSPCRAFGSGSCRIKPRGGITKGPLGVCHTFQVSSQFKV